MMDNSYLRDVAAGAEAFDFSPLKGSRVFVTGATGLVCSAVVDMLLACGARVYAAGRSGEKVQARFGDRVCFVAYDATKPLDFEEDVDYVIHGASNALPSFYTSKPVDTMMANIVGIRNLMEYAAVHPVKKVLYVSSSEVYGRKDTMEPFREDDYGFVDLLTPRSSYPMGKRAAETLCACYGREYGIPFSIVRLGHIYGPTAARSDMRVSSAFAYQAAGGEDLVMKSEGRQLRSYCYCVDCATGILTVLLRGASGEAYNISNKDSIITIRQMAELIAQSSGVSLRMELPTEAEKQAFNPMDNSSLSSEKLEQLGWRGLFDAPTGFRHTIQALKNNI